MSRDSQIKLIDFLSTSSALLHSEGLKVFGAMIEVEAKRLVLSFEGVEHCTMAFLNASVGKFLVATSGTTEVIFQGASADVQNKLALIDDYIKDERKRVILDEIAHSYLSSE